MTSKRTLAICTAFFLCAIWPLLLQAGSDHRQPFSTVHVNDIDIAYHDLGAGDPIIMIMGYGGSMDLWSARLLQILSASHHLFIFDNRGMGHSTSSDMEYSIPLFATDTLGLMDACGIDRAAVLGWSMGAEVALQLAISHPERVGSLILISGSPGGTEQVVPDADVLRRLTNTSGGFLARGLRLISLLFPSAWLNAHPALWSYFPVNATVAPHERSQRQLKAIEDWEGAASRLGDILCPTLIITGSEDVVFPTQNSVLLAGGIHGSRLIQFPEGGHGVMFQYPDKIGEEIDAFTAQTR
jgi:pimeloyl-ACP methyl ester carboxylesterase